MRVSRKILIAAVALAMCSGQWAFAVEVDYPDYRVDDPMEFELLEYISQDEDPDQIDPAPAPGPMIMSQPELMPRQESPSDLEIPPQMNHAPEVMDQILTESPQQVDVVDAACCHSGYACCCRRSVPNMLGDISLGAPFVVRNAARNLRADRPFARVATNNNVMPQTRFGVSYHHYEDAPRQWTNAGVVQHTIDIDEVQFHFEKSFCCDAYSLQLNVPLYETVAFEQNAATFGDSDVELGNISIGAKAVVYEDCCSAVSAGLLVELPTMGEHSGPGLLVENDSWYFTPYLGMQYTPNDCWFAHGFVSYRIRSDDLETTQAAVAVVPSPIDADRLMVDAGVGYWLFRDCCGCGLVTGLAPTLELHYMTYTEEQDNRTIFQTTFFDRVDYLNLTLGATAELCTGGSLASGLLVSLRDNTVTGGNLDSDRPYDWGFILQYNHRY